MRALLAPYNFAGQPVLLARALRERGVDAEHLLYAWNGRRDYGYPIDRAVQLDRTNWLEVQLGVLSEVVEQRPDVVHLWNRSLIAPAGGFGFFSGLDLPFLKAAGIRIVYRFTGYDLRDPERERAVNPYSPLWRGFDPKIDPEARRSYLGHLRQWVDRFVVQDPEMRGYLPEAEVIPRAIDLDAFPYLGVEPTRRPLLMHAPSSRATKGTDAVLAAVDALRGRGVDFDFELVEGVSHAEATERYRRADVVIDQLLIGWYGVVALEAMALGKPVVAHLLPGLAEEVGAPVPVVGANPDDLADRLEPLIRDPALRVVLGRRGRAFAEEVHDVRKVAATVEDLYRRVAEAPAPVTDAAPRHLATMAGAQLDVLVRAHRYERMRSELSALRDRVAGRREGRG